MRKPNKVKSSVYNFIGISFVKHSIQLQLFLGFQHIHCLKCNTQNKSSTPLHPCSSSKVTGCRDWIETRIWQDWPNKLGDFHVLHKCQIILEQADAWTRALAGGYVRHNLACTCFWVLQAGCLKHICILKAWHSSCLTSLVSCNLAQFGWLHDSAVMD